MSASNHSQPKATFLRNRDAAHEAELAYYRTWLASKPKHPDAAIVASVLRDVGSGVIPECRSLAEDEE